jgi:trimethylamine--corrinoid protein Co-methyltransferase
MAKRLIGGIQKRDDPIALTLMRKMGHRADYLADPHTLRWFKQELYLPSSVIDRGAYDIWESDGATTAFERASRRVKELLKSYQPSPLSEDLREELRSTAAKAAKQFGMDELPPLPDDDR